MPTDVGRRARDSGTVDLMKFGIRMLMNVGRSSNGQCFNAGKLMDVGIMPIG